MTSSIGWGGRGRGGGEGVTDGTTSRNGVPIRLTDERWSHITEEHNELAGLRPEVLETVAHPERVIEG